MFVKICECVSLNVSPSDKVFDKDRQKNNKKMGKTCALNVISVDSFDRAHLCFDVFLFFIYSSSRNVHLVSLERLCSMASCGFPVLL